MPLFIRERSARYWDGSLGATRRARRGSFGFFFPEAHRPVRLRLNPEPLDVGQFRRRGKVHEQRRRGTKGKPSPLFRRGFCPTFRCTRCARPERSCAGSRRPGRRRPLVIRDTVASSPTILCVGRARPSSERGGRKRREEGRSVCRSVQTKVSFAYTQTKNDKRQTRVGHWQNISLAILTCS
jgi:hypothetical protein